MKGKYIKHFLVIQKKTHPNDKIIHILIIVYSTHDEYKLEALIQPLKILILHFNIQCTCALKMTVFVQKFIVIDCN